MKNVIGLVGLLICVGCNFGGDHSAPVAANTPLPVPGDGWITEQDSNGDAADLTITRMAPGERERVRGEVSRNSVTWINSKSGYSLYKITGSERFEKNAFILPKVLVIGSVDGEIESI